MPYRIYCFCIFLVGLCIAGLSYTSFAATPELSASDKKHAENAFYFAERQNWHEAMLHARRAKNPLLREYITWAALKDWDSKFAFADFEAFLTKNPGWPLEKRLLLQAEDMLFTENGSVDLKRKIHWFNLHPPISGRGKVVYAQALASYYGEERVRPQVTKLIREAWRNGDFNSHQEKSMLQEYGYLLRTEDHIARIDRLIWEKKTDHAARILFLAPKGYQSLFEARVRLSLNKPGVNQAVARVPAALAKDPGLTYERMKWREREGLDDGVREMLLAAPATVPFPEKWWPTRHKHVRKALDENKPALALKLLKNHGQTEGSEKGEALWLQGWINLSWLKQPSAAFPYFKEMEQVMQYPVSKSRAAYWAGRTTEAMKRQDAARAWYARASAYTTTFYGQLAAAKLHAQPQLTLPAIDAPDKPQQQRFGQDKRVKVARMLQQMGRPDEALNFIRHLMDEATSHTQALLTAALAVESGQTHFGVIVSKEALKQHIVLPKTSYPYYRLPFVSPVEAPLVWAITRQESLFNPQARSASGAQGLMQLMPGTAKEVARKADLPYQPGKIYDGTYNLQLGSHYLSHMVRQFDGSYILAIASYNAGPGRIRQWLNTYGHPGKTPEQAVDWIERIPYSETRNYVQRVLENLQVYRAVLDPRNGRYIHIEADLKR